MLETFSPFFYPLSLPNDTLYLNVLFNVCSTVFNGPGYEIQEEKEILTGESA